MTHPSSLVLESYACGEPLRADLLAHVEECEECGAFVGELRGLAASGPSKADAEASVARAAHPARAARPEPKEPKEPKAALRVVGSKRRSWMIATTVLTPLAAAAAIVLLARSAPLPGSAPSQPAAEPSGDTLRMGALPPRAEPETRFKGATQIAVVRERGGQQTRFSAADHSVPVRAGDRLRVEVALDREQAILGAVLAEDGSYLEVMPEAVRGAGTHFSERSAKIDAAPTRGTIVVGSPEAVARARRTRAKELDGVATFRVEPEP